MRTARRWAREGRMPAAWSRLWLLLTSRDLGHIDDKFAGVQLRDGALFLPGGWRVTIGDLRAMPITEQLIAEMRHKLATPKQLLL